MAKIHKLARKGDLAAVVSMLDSGTDVNTAERVTGATLMHIASANDSIKMMQLLVDRGADLYAPSVLGTPLHFAKSPEAAQLLITSGVEIDVRSKSGMTPLHDAAQSNTSEMVEFFLENGANVNAETEKGKMPLDFAIDQEVRELLQDAGGVNEEPKEPTKFGAWVDRSASVAESMKLDKMVRKGNVEKVRQLLENGVASEDAIWLALAGELDSGVIMHSEIVSWIAAGNRMSPAHSEIALLLIEAGYDIDSPTQVGLTALGRAKRWEGFPPVAIRVTYSPNTAFGILFTPNDEDPVLHSDELGFSPLHVAVINDDAGVITALLAKGADTVARTADDETPLHWAALYAAPAAARLLIAAGADVNARTAEPGETPLAWTSRWLAGPRMRTADRANVEAVAVALREHGGIE